MKMRLHQAVLVLFVLFLGSCTSDSIEDIPVIEAENVLHVEQELLQIINGHRVSMNTNSLEFSEVAYKYANTHTDYMISKGTISHDNFSARASNISAEVAVEMVAENVAKDYDNAIEAFEGWYSSKNHRSTMEGDFTHTAISVKVNAEGNYYFTQLFYKL
ncbi:MAG: CAP domain-containing protein [Maribacter sp.]